MKTRAKSTRGTNNPIPLPAEDRQTNSTTAATTTTSVNSNPNNNNQRGNLHSLLKAYDQTMKNNNPTNEANDASTIGERVIEGNDSISVQLDNMGRERSSTLGSIRDRGLTFGSEFDLGLGLTNDTLVHDAVFDLSVVNGQQGQGQVQGGQGGGGQSKDKGTFKSDSNNNSQNNQNIKMNPPQTQSSSMPQDNPVQHGFTAVSAKDNSSISAGFLNRLFSSNPNPNQLQQQHQQQSHTPPSATATSYEIKHFGKRLRSGVCILHLYSFLKGFNLFIFCHVISYTVIYFPCFLSFVIYSNRVYQVDYDQCQTLKTGV